MGGIVRPESTFESVFGAARRKVGSDGPIRETFRCVSRMTLCVPGPARPSAPIPDTRSVERESSWKDKRILRWRFWKSGLMCTREKTDLNLVCIQVMVILHLP